jgi:hypothetical protein
MTIYRAKLRLIFLLVSVFKFFKNTASSDKISKLNSYFCSIDLLISKTFESSNDDDAIKFEMDKENLIKWIENLEKIKLVTFLNFFVINLVLSNFQGM